MFFTLKGVKGDAQAKGFEDTITVLAWSWGMSQTGTTHVGTGGGAGKVNVQDLSITKYVDKASPTLMHACCTGKHFEDATLSVRKAGGEQLVYLKIDIKDIIITSLSTGGSGGEDRLTENVTFNFASVKFGFQPQDKNGAKLGGEVSASYDIAKVAG